MSAGKGDKRRPRGEHVSEAEYADRWERTFRAKRKETQCQETPKKSSK